MCVYLFLLHHLLYVLMIKSCTNYYMSITCHKEVIIIQKTYQSLMQIGSLNMLGDIRFPSHVNGKIWRDK